MAITVLIMDDAKDFVDYTSRRLTARGMTVLAAHSGQEALDLLGRQPVDVVVLDVLLPGMDGFQVLREIRKTNPTLPALMLTGHGTVESAEEGMKLGVVDFLLKPCDFETLLAAILKASGQEAGKS